MPSCSKAKNPRGVTITFTEDDHKYSSIINNKEITYISGTTFISKFFPPFDPTGAITKACAKKRGLTVEALKAQWRRTADESCRYGTKVHERMEDWIKGQNFRGKANTDKESFALKNADLLAKKLLIKLDSMESEKIVFDENIKIAGTIDLLARSKKDGKLWIIDFKTNKEILTENKYNNFGLHCIKHIPAINFHEYAVQLNLYEYILKSAGYINENEQVGKTLFHISEKGVHSYPLPNYQKEVKDMIDFYQNGGFNK